MHCVEGRAQLGGKVERNADLWRLAADCGPVFDLGKSSGVLSIATWTGLASAQ